MVLHKITMRPQFIRKIPLSSIPLNNYTSMQSFPYPSEPQSVSVCHIGYLYSQEQGKQIFFNQAISQPYLDPQIIIRNYQAYYRSLEKQLDQIKLILINLLDQGKEVSPPLEEQTIQQLLERLMELILSKEEQNHQLYLQNHYLKNCLDLYLSSQSSLYSSQKEEQRKEESKVEICSDLQLPASNSFQHLLSSIQAEDSEGYRNSESSAKTCSKYKPRVLFEIGKQVKTINELSSQQFVTLKSQLNTISKNGSRQPSFKQLTSLKQKAYRLSIDGSMNQRGSQNHERNRTGQLFCSNKKNPQNKLTINSIKSIISIPQNHFSIIESQQKNKIIPKKVK